MVGVARPVRIAPKSSLATPTAFSSFSSASRRIMSIWSLTGTPVAASGWRVSARVGRHDGADPLTAHDARDVPVGQQVEHDDRHRVVLAEAEGGGVGDLEVLRQDLGVADLVVEVR